MCSTKKTIEELREKRKNEQYEDALAYARSSLINLAICSDSLDHYGRAQVRLNAEVLEMFEKRV